MCKNAGERIRIGLHISFETQTNKQKQSIMDGTNNTAAAAVNESSMYKNLLTSDEAARFLGISKSYLYKLTMQRRIPHYKPCGKLNYFDRSELEEWAKSVKVPTMNEIEATAQAYCRTKKGAL